MQMCYCPLIKIFISSHQSLTVLNNEWFRQLVNVTIDIPSFFHYFRNHFLKDIKDMVHEAINEKIKKARNVTLIPDIWEDNGDHFLGLGATVVNEKTSTYSRNN